VPATTCTTGRRVPGLNQATQPAEVPDGVYLVRVYRAQYRRARPEIRRAQEAMSRCDLTPRVRR
jgi:hypothetical protein